MTLNISTLHRQDISVLQYKNIYIPIFQELWETDKNLINKLRYIQHFSCRFHTYFFIFHMNVQVENLQPIVHSNHRQWISKYLKNFEKVQLIAFEQANPACLAPLSTKRWHRPLLSHSVFFFITVLQYEANHTIGIITLKANSLTTC